MSDGDQFVRHFNPKNPKNREDFYSMPTDKTVTITLKEDDALNILELLKFFSDNYYDSDLLIFYDALESRLDVDDKLLSSFDNSIQVIESWF